MMMIMMMIIDLYNFVYFVLKPPMEVVVALVLVLIILKQSSLPDHNYVLDAWLEDIDICDYNDTIPEYMNVRKFILDR